MDLDKTRLKNGDKLKINKILYEVLYVQGETDPFPHHDPPIRSYFAVYLHDHKTKTLFPTHMIKYYYEDTKEIFLIELRGKRIEQKDIVINGRV